MPTLAEDRDAIRDLFARYCLYTDSGRADEFAALFTEDGTFETGGDPLVGRDALRAFVANMPDLGMHHMLTNLVIDVDGDTATCDASALVTAKGSIMMTAHTHDDLRRVDGAWQIERRTYQPDATE
jgi:uncharacterized protein (TIGR02246 family)